MANRFLNNITINDEYTLPSVDGTAGQAITTDGAGNLSFSTVDSDSALKITLRVKNVSGGTLNAGTLVRVSPTNPNISGNVLEVDVADNSSASTMPAVGILVDQLSPNAEGDCVAFGRASGFSTSGFSQGDTLYVGTSGAFTTTKPTGSNLIQRIGQVIKVDSSNGSIEVFGAGRSNDVPNLSVGKIWVGTTTNTAESTLVEIDETNNILTVGGAIYYSNVFAQESDLPSATTYHGMFAHVHGTGYAYYAHVVNGVGAWVKLAKHSELVAAANDSTVTITAGTGLSGGGTFTTDQATDSSVTVNLADTAVTAGTYGDANNTPQITIDQQGRITSATTVTTAGSGSGGGGGAELSIERDIITATANQQAFTISSDITASSNTQVYIDGVYQAKSNYTTSGSVITFSTGVPAGAEVEVVHFISVLSKVYTDTFTGDASTVDFTASKDVSDENVTQVYIDGVYQSKDNYTTSGTTITFSTAPPSGSAIEVVHFTPATYSTLNSNQFTGTGSQTDFTLTQAVDVDTSFVFIQGVYQEKDTYSISGTTLTFNTAPLSGYSIEVITVGAVANVTSSPVNSVNGLTGDVTVSGGTDWQATPKTANFPAVAGEGYFVDTTSTAITVTLPSSPTAGDEISLVDYGANASTNNITITSSDNIEGAADDLVLSTDKSSRTLVYSDATKGWLVATEARAGTAAAAASDFSADYLVVAGGGGGAGGGFGDGSSGGGGAGGLRTSYGSTSGGGASAESSLTLNITTTYTVSVGPGGAGGNGSTLVPGSNGTSSYISGTGITTITSNGGGGGDCQDGTAAPTGGGSGGGGAGGGSPVSSFGAAGTTDQGYAGGDAYGAGGSGASNYLGGGGGGAGAAGGDATNTVPGAGGGGLEVNIIGTSGNYYAGGGGSGDNKYGGLGLAGSGGTGGGGAGGANGALGTNGTPNTGGGGGASSGATADNIGAQGGSGVVILRYPSDYTITETTSGGDVLSFTTDDTTVSGTKITTFTAGTNGTIQFAVA
jgi:hypothetical protein